MAVARPCPRCGRLNCQEHQATPWRSSGPAPPRVRGRQLQAMRARLFAAFPLCVICLLLGKTSPSTIRDHLVPLAEGGRDDETNEQALCQECSDAKTREESKRGVRRWPHA
jgi:5-methylcytosine-specific restriction protein A